MKREILDLNTNQTVYMRSVCGKRRNYIQIIFTNLKIRGEFGKKVSLYIMLAYFDVYRQLKIKPSSQCLVNQPVETIYCYNSVFKISQSTQLIKSIGQISYFNQLSAINSRINQLLNILLLNRDKKNSKEHNK